MIQYHMTYCVVWNDPIQCNVISLSYHITYQWLRPANFIPLHFPAHCCWHSVSWFHFANPAPVCRILQNQLLRQNLSWRALVLQTAACLLACAVAEPVAWFLELVLNKCRTTKLFQPQTQLDPGLRGVTAEGGIDFWLLCEYMDSKHVPLCYQLKYTLGPGCPQTFAVMVVMVVMVVIMVQTLNTGSDSERFALFWMES